MKSEYLNERTKISSTTVKAATDFIGTAKNISRKMAASYTQKKKAYESSKEQFNSTGSLDLSRIANYKTSDDIFKKNKMTKTGNNHGLVCAIDFSSSMSRELGQVAMQFLITALFAKKIKIPFIIYTFTAQSEYTDTDVESWNKQPSFYEGVEGASGRSFARKPRFTVIANEKMSETDIINSYYHILSVYAEARDWQTTFTHKYKSFLTKYYSMGITPIIHSTYQSYLLAYNMKQRGIENVNILTIADGGNNVYFKGIEREKEDKTWYVRDAVECPYTKRVFTINKNNNRLSSDNDQLISALNRMTRTAGIKTFNLFIQNKMQHKKVLRRAVSDVCRGHDNNSDVYQLVNGHNIKNMQDEMRANGMAIIENLCYYDKVIFTTTNVFPELEASSDDKKDLSDVSAYRYLKSKNEDLKGLTSLGRLLSDIMVADFKLGF